MIHSRPIAVFSGRHQANQQVPIIDLATDTPIGYFSSEYLNTAARTGLTFFFNNKVWKILYITDDESVFVLPLKELNVILRDSISEKDQKEIETGPHQDTPSTRQIIVESFHNYLIIHAQVGNPVNSTLRLAFDAMLTEQDLTRDSYNDASRILIQTPLKLSREELESIVEDLSHVSTRELEKFLKKAIGSIFPTVVSERIHSSKNSQGEDRLERKLRLGLDVESAKAILRDITEGKIKILTHFSTVMATHTAKELIEQRAKQNALNLDTLIQENTSRFKKAVQNRTAALLCLNCLLSRGLVKISEMEYKPICKRCGSGLLAIVGVSERNILQILRKKRSGKHLDPHETEQLAKTRRTADLILSYGKRAVIALTVIGVGPQTASTILASMHTSIYEFYFDLLKAKIHYITTRDLWRKARTTTSFENHGKFNI